MNHKNHVQSPMGRSFAAPTSDRAARPSPLYPPAIKTAGRGNERVKFSDTRWKRMNFGTVPVVITEKLQMTRHPKNSQRKSNEPSTAGGRERGLEARPPARFSSLRSKRLVNHKQVPSGNTLLAQRYPLSGNSYFWRTGNREPGRAKVGSPMVARFEEATGQCTALFKAAL